MRSRFNAWMMSILVVFMFVVGFIIWTNYNQVQILLEGLDEAIKPVLEAQNSKSIQDYLDTKKNFLEKFYTDRASGVDTMLGVVGLLLGLFGLILPFTAKMLTDKKLKKIEDIEKTLIEQLYEIENLKEDMDKQLEQLKGIQQTKDS